MATQKMTDDEREYMAEMGFDQAEKEAYIARWVDRRIEDQEADAWARSAPMGGH